MNSSGVEFTFVWDVIRSFLGAIDTAVYWFMELLVKIFNTIATTPLFSTAKNGPIDQFADRLYVLISIIMIFKVSFSIIQYIINPDTFTSSEKGMSKLVQSVLVVLISIVGVRYVFKIAYDLQEKIVNTHTIEKIVLGLDSKLTPDKQQQVQDLIPCTVMSAFLKPVGGYENQFNFKHECWKNFNHITDKAGDSSRYALDYTYIVSTVAGVFVVIIYLNFCIDVAIRAAKFGFLQLIAPIPIISMVDPKSAKSGMMSKWIKECVNTYLGLFLRIAAVSFVLFIINIIMGDNFLDSSFKDQDIYIKLVFIFGALMFAKELPKLISDLTGVDFKGDFKLNPFKRVVDNTPGAKQLGMLGKTAAAGALGAVGGLAANGVNLARNWSNMSKKERASNAVGLFTGALSSGIRGATSKEKNIFKAAGSGIKGSVAARNLRDARQAVGDDGYGGIIRRVNSNLDNWAGVDAAATKFDKQDASYNDLLKIQSDLDSFLDTELMVKGKGPDGANLQAMQAEIDIMTNNGFVMPTKSKKESNSAYLARVEAERAKYSVSLAQKKKDLADAKKKAKIEMISNRNNASSGADVAAINAYLSKMNDIVNQNSSTDGFSKYIGAFDINSSSVDIGQHWDDIKGDIKTAQNNMYISDEYKKAMVNKKNDTK